MKLGSTLKASIIFLGIVAAGFLIWIAQGDRITPNNAVAYEFTGTLQEYTDNVLLVSGVYALEGNPESDSPQEPVLVEITIAPSTRITRTILTLPSQEELRKTEGRFDTDKLPRKDSEADISILQKDISGEFGLGIFAVSDENIAGKKSFTATEINYRTVMRP